MTDLGLRTTMITSIYSDWDYGCVYWSGFCRESRNERTVFLGVPICIWVDMASKSEKIAENCTFFFVDYVKCYMDIAK